VQNYIYYIYNFITAQLRCTIKLIIVFIHKILLYSFFYFNTTLLFTFIQSDYKFVKSIAGFIIYYLSLVYTFA